MDLRSFSNLEELVLIDLSPNFELSAVSVTSKIQTLRIIVPKVSCWEERCSDDYNESIHANLVYIRNICKRMVVNFEEDKFLDKFNHSDYEN